LGLGLYVTLLELPLVVEFEQDSADEADAGFLLGKMPTTLARPYDGTNKRHSPASLLYITGNAFQSRKRMRPEMMKDQPDIALGDQTPTLTERRPNRLDSPHPNLLPMLRNPSGGPGEASAARCAGCSQATEIFPFTMAFQPIVDIQECRIDAHEALVRGIDGAGAGRVLEQLTPETLYAFDQACRVKAIELAVKLKIEGRLNINFLPNAVYEPRACIQTTLQTAARTNFDPRRLTFEIVETETIANTPHLMRIIREYHRHGFQVALDDFGTGYSGLLRLAELEPNIIKLDRMLIKDCDLDQRRLAIVAHSIAMAAAIGVKVVVEGVERIGEVEALRSVGARFMQGFYFAKPAFERIVQGGEIAWVQVSTCSGAQ